LPGLSSNRYDVQKVVTAELAALKGLTCHGAMSGSATMWDRFHSVTFGGVMIFSDLTHLLGAKSPKVNFGNPPFSNSTVSHCLAA
jgi:hypothetical protein